MSMYMMMRRMSQDPDIAHHQLSQGVVRRVLRFAKPYRFLIAVFVALVVILAALAVAPASRCYRRYWGWFNAGFLQRSAKA